MGKLSIVGRELDRPDGMDKATGRARYVDDVELPGMLYAGIVYSQKARAKILEVDTSAARAMPGVEDVFTARDIPGTNLIPLIKADWPFLADAEARYVGEPIAVVTVKNRDALREACEAVKIRYEELPPILDAEQSLCEDAPQINPLGNVLAYHKIRTGDVERAFAEAPVVVEGVYETGYQEHAYIETQAMLATPQSGGRIEVFGSMQCPFYVHNALAAILGLPQSRLRVIQAPTGGAFGGKEDVPSLFAGLTALAAQRTGRPVKMVLTREDDMLMTSKRHPAKMYYRHAADRDGRLLAIEARVILDGGAYATLSPPVSWRCCIHACGPYRCPNVKVDVWAMATNKVPCGAFRGFGTPKVIFAHERQMDRLAERLGMDPMQLRLKNIWKKGDATATGHRLTTSVGLGRTVRSAMKLSEWKKKRGSAGWCERAAGDRSTRRRGIGAAVYLYGVGLGAAGRKIDKSEAYVQVGPDGSAMFAVGNTEIGQGMQTVLAQIVAEGLGGLPLSMVQMLEVDTTRVQDSGPTVASRATYMSGNALLDACAKIRRLMRPAAARMLGCRPGQVVFRDGRVFAKNGAAGSRSLSFAEVAARCHQEHIALSRHGFFDSPPTSWDPETGHGEPYVTYAYATQIAEVEVDIETAEVSVKKVWASHDVGKAINPALVRGQIEGGVLQGMAYALMEFIKTDETGRIRNNAFSTYILPTIGDMPEITAHIVESRWPEGPFGAKGFSETPLMGMAGAVGNAVAHALGVNPTRVPMLPEYLFDLLEEQRR
ncbi:MAG: hypothetical protein Kow0059_13860 [Candidatus Sumerlaeia bacterium]